MVQLQRLDQMGCFRRSRQVDENRRFSAAIRQLAGSGSAARRKFAESASGSGTQMHRPASCKGEGGQMAPLPAQDCGGHLFNFVRKTK